MSVFFFFFFFSHASGPNAAPSPTPPRCGGTLSLSEIRFDLYSLANTHVHTLHTHLSTQRWRISERKTGLCSTECGWIRFIIY